MGQSAYTLVIILSMSAGLAWGQALSLRPESVSAPDTAHYKLGPQDQLKIWALGVEEITDKPVQVDPAGDIDLPIVGKVHAGGMTVDQLKTDLLQRFSKDVLHPQVSIEVVEYGSQPVSVIGAVNHPGVYQVRGRRTLAEMISSADGLRQDAGPSIVISRQSKFGAIPLPSAKVNATGDYNTAEIGVKELLAGSNPTENILVLPQDVITVPVAEAVFVMGEVRKPGEVYLKSNASISVLQALSSAEGFGPMPAPQQAKIVRLTSNGRERLEIPVDLRKIMTGKAEDLAMKPNDILVVPPSGPKKVAARALEAAIQTATGIAIWRRY